MLDLAAADWLLASLAGSEVAAEVMRHRGDLYGPARLVQLRRVVEPLAGRRSLDV
jgi:hypothetical protein